MFTTPDGISFSDAFWQTYDARMMRVLMITLSLILAQTIVLFIGGSLAWCALGRRQRARLRNTADAGVAVEEGKSAPRVQAVATPPIAIEPWGAKV